MNQLVLLSFAKQTNDQTILSYTLSSLTKIQKRHSATISFPVYTEAINDVYSIKVSAKIKMTVMN